MRGELKVGRPYIDTLEGNANKFDWLSPKVLVLGDKEGEGGSE